MTSHRDERDEQKTTKATKMTSERFFVFFVVFCSNLQSEFLPITSRLEVFLVF